jgi:geranylgeranyl diphosphate synthase type II
MRDLERGGGMTNLNLACEDDASFPIHPWTARGLSRERWIDLRLADLLPKQGAGSGLLIESVRDACLSRGKRVRPVLSMLSAAHFGGSELAAADFGCALELVHTASLILDDLPCMDNAAVRRGRPAFHRRHGEDTAVLAAVALLNQAYAVIGADRALCPETRLALQGLVSDTVGFCGLVSGQCRDLREAEQLRTEEALTSLNHEKTGVMFVAAALGGALIAGADQADQRQARLFGARLGLAFQLWDDVQDLTSTLEIMGKDARQDDGRVTFVTLWGVERTLEAVGETLQAALTALGSTDSALAQYTQTLFRAAGYGS